MEPFLILAVFLALVSLGGAVKQGHERTKLRMLLGPEAAFSESIAVPFDPELVARIGDKISSVGVVSTIVAGDTLYDLFVIDVLGHVHHLPETFDAKKAETLLQELSTQLDVRVEDPEELFPTVHQ